MDHLNNPDKRGRTIHHWRGAAEHLNSVDVAQVQCRQRGIESSAPWHAIDNQQKSVELFQSPEIRNGTRGSRVSSGRDLNAGCERKRAAKVCGAARSQFVSAN